MKKRHVLVSNASPNNDNVPRSLFDLLSGFSDSGTVGALSSVALGAMGSTAFGEHLELWVPKHLEPALSFAVG